MRFSRVKSKCSSKHPFGFSDMTGVSQDRKVNPARIEELVFFFCTFGKPPLTTLLGSEELFMADRFCAEFAVTIVDFGNHMLSRQETNCNLRFWSVARFQSPDRFGLSVQDEIPLYRAIGRDNSVCSFIHILIL